MTDSRSAASLDQALLAQPWMLVSEARDARREAHPGAGYSGTRCELSLDADDRPRRRSSRCPRGRPATRPAEPIPVAGGSPRPRPDHGPTPGARSDARCRGSRSRVRLRSLGRCAPRWRAQRLSPAERTPALDCGDGRPQRRDNLLLGHDRADPLAHIDDAIRGVGDMLPLIYWFRKRVTEVLEQVWWQLRLRCDSAKHQLRR